MGDFEVLTMMMDCGGEIIKKKTESQVGYFKACCNKFVYVKEKAKDYPLCQLAVEQILCRHHEIMLS